ncbi:hypothetical protein BJX64DRAFT_272891 [Aspergillus heterothallicus]
MTELTFVGRPMIEIWTAVLLGVIVMACYKAKHRSQQRTQLKKLHLLHECYKSATPLKRFPSTNVRTTTPSVTKNPSILNLNVR